MGRMKAASLGRTFGTVGILTILSKIAGLIRDMVVARAYGAGVLSDAYNYAYLFTGNVLILFGGLGGPFHSATVAVLTPRKNNRESGTLILQVMLLTSAVLTLIAVIVCVFAPDLLQAIQSLLGQYGATSADTRAKFCTETIKQIRVMSPLIVIAGLIGVTYGILNVYDMIFWPSLSPAIVSFAIIVGLLLFPNRNSSLPLAVATLVGAMGQLSAQLPSMLKCPLNYRLIRDPAPGLNEYRAMLYGLPCSARPLVNLRFMWTACSATASTRVPGRPLTMPTV